MRKLFLITLFASLFYVTQAKAHCEQDFFSDTFIDKFLEHVEKRKTEKRDKLMKCLLQPKEYRNKDCPKLYVLPMNSE